MSLYVAEKPPPEVIGLINGNKPASKEEWRTYVAIVHYKLDFRYQVPVAGGRRLPGGRVLDFLVALPFWTPVPVMGKYWHSGKKGEDDRMMLALLEEYYRIPPIPLWDYELTSIAHAIETVGRKLHV